MRRRPLVVAVIVAILVASISAGLWLRGDLQPASAREDTPDWTSAANYPVQVAGAGCATSSEFVYCVGGNSTDVYYASLNGTGIQSWIRTTAYPVVPDSPSCVAYERDLYCISGSDVYYASVNSSGVGKWIAGPSYPSNVFGNTCAAYSGYIYCVGAEEMDVQLNTTSLDYVYYAQIGPEGVGPWVQTNSYPVATVGASCITVIGYIFCIGGQNLDSLQIGGGYILSSVYYAKLNSSGVFDWTQTASYPINVELESCSVFSFASPVIYCVSGQRYSTSGSHTLSDVPNVYYAYPTSSGISSWATAKNYPASLQGLSCIASVTTDSIYCMGGAKNQGPSTTSSYYGMI